MSNVLFSKRVLTVVCTSAMIVGFVAAFAPSIIAADKPIEWNVSLWGGKRAWTNPLHDWLADMKKATNGQWKINIHYGGVLAPPKENWDGIRAGKFEAARY